MPEIRVVEMSKIRVVESVIESLVKSVGPKTFFCALHNAFYHGDVVVYGAGCPLSDEQLGEMFVHLEALVEVGKEIEN